MLEMVLGNSPRTLSIGATRLLWKLGFEDNLLLPSGQRFLEDPMWSAVSDTLGADLPRKILHGLNRYVRQRSLPALIAKAASGIEQTELTELRRELGGAFQTIARHSGREYLIESSSTAAYTVLLNNLPGVTTYNVHLLRHPRAVSYSWARPKPQPETGSRSEMVTRPQRKSDADWLSTNFGIIAAERIGLLPHCVRTNYEELCLRPMVLMNRIDDMTSRLTKGVGGNPMRFQEGKLTIRYDSRWKEAHSGAERSVWADAFYRLAKRA